MLLTVDIVPYLMARTGQFILGDISNLGLNYGLIWQVLSPELNLFQRHIPLVQKFNIYVPEGFGTAYNFTYDQNNPGFNPTDPDNIIYGVPPKYLSNVVPVDVYQMVPTIAAFFPNFREVTQPNRVVNPQISPRDYRSPMLYVTMCGKYDITAAYDYQVNLTPTNPTSMAPLTEVEIVGLENNTTVGPDRTPILMELFLGKFMQQVGLSRRIFTYSDMPMTLDSASLVSEGMAIYKAAKEDLIANNDWHLSIMT